MPPHRRNHARAEVAQTANSPHFGRLRPEEQLARWGLRQQRQVTTEQLREVGWDASTVRDRVTQSRLHPVFAEVYSLGGPPRTARETWMASVLTFGPGAVLTASPAAELYGWLRYPLRQLHVITPTKRDPRDGIVPHHHSRPVRWRYVDDIPVACPEQVILDCALTLRSDKAYRRIVRQAQVDELVSHARLVAFAALNRGARGVARLKHELADGPSPTRSGLEDEALEVFRHGGPPLVNAEVFDEEVDLYWPALGVVIEIDGSPHDNPTAKADDAAKQARLEERGLRMFRLR
jgi:hypothetical protein